MVEVRVLERPSDTLRQDLTPGHHFNVDHSSRGHRPQVPIHLGPPRGDEGVVIPQISRDHLIEGPTG